MAGQFDPNTAQNLLEVRCVVPFDWVVLMTSLG